MIPTPLKERHAPQWRVLAYIKDPLYGGNGARKFVEIKGFKNVSTNLSMSGQGSATISFPDHKSALLRFISYDSIVDSESKNSGVETTNTYAIAWLDAVMSDSSSNYFKGMWNDTVVSRGDVKFMDPANARFVEQSRSRGNILSNKDLNAIKSLQSSDTENFLIYALPFIDLFDPVFVDAKGQDGFWYAKFTGFVTRVQDSYARTGGQELQINCKDMSVLLDNVSLVTAWNKIPEAEKKTILNDFVYSIESNLVASNHVGYSNVFADPRLKSMQDIILKIIGDAQAMWRMDKFGDNVGIKAFKFDTGKAFPYYGISGRRGSIQIANNNPINMNPNIFKSDHTLVKHHYLYDPNTLLGEKKILIDPMLQDFDNLFIHKTLSSGLALYKDSMKSADAIIADLVAKMMAYRYFDGNGNLIIECPKLNALPNLDTYGGRSNATALRYKNPDPIKRTQINTKKTVIVQKGDTIARYFHIYGVDKQTLFDLNKDNKAVFTRIKGQRTGLRIGATVILGDEIEEQFSDPLTDVKNMWVAPDYASILTDKDSDYLWSTLLFHGKNYVMSNDDFITFSTAVDEAPLYTVAAMDAVFPMLEVPGEQLNNASPSLHGAAVADFDKLAKIGVRRFQTQSIYNVTWPNRLVGTRVLSHMAATVLERANAQADTGSLVLNHRPDLQLGRTYINLLRMKSYLILGITDSWTSGGAHSTTLTLGFGHPLHKTLAVPWSAIFAQPGAFGIQGGIDGFQAIKPAGTDGERTLDETYESNTEQPETRQA